MSLQNIPKTTRANEIESQLYFAWEYIEWINEKYPEIYDEYVKEMNKK